MKALNYYKKLFDKTTTINTSLKSDNKDDYEYEDLDDLNARTSIILPLAPSKY